MAVIGVHFFCVGEHHYRSRRPPSLTSATLKRVTRLGPPARTGYLSSAELAPLLRVRGYSHAALGVEKAVANLRLRCSNACVSQGVFT